MAVSIASKHRQNHKKHWAFILTKIYCSLWTYLSGGNPDRIGKHCPNDAFGAWRRC